jgi:hypothetical protein
MRRIVQNFDVFEPLKCLSGFRKEPAAALPCNKKGQRLGLRGLIGPTQQVGKQLLQAAGI